MAAPFEKVMVCSFLSHRDVSLKGKRQANGRMAGTAATGPQHGRTSPRSNGA